MNAAEWNPLDEPAEALETPSGPFAGLMAWLTDCGLSPTLEQTAPAARSAKRTSIRTNCPICKTTPNGHGQPITMHMVPGWPITATCGCQPARLRAWIVGASKGDARKGASIVSNGRPLPDVRTEALNSLVLANWPPRIFVRGGELVRVRSDEKDQPIVEPLKDRSGRATAALRNLAGDAAHYSMINGRDQRVTMCGPPAEIMNAIVALEELPFPALEAVVQAPTLRPDGTVLSSPGYDAATHLLLRPNAKLRVPTIPAQPTQANATTAIEQLLALFADFPFVDDSDLANLLAFVLTPLVRPAISGPVPLALFNGTRAGTGKNLLAAVIAIIATGRPANVQPIPATEEEWRKSIASTLDAGHPIIVLDEAAELRSASLASALTADIYETRRLGYSDNMRVPNRATWIACGNGIRLGGDLPRRCVWINLNARTARPWQRTFKIGNLEDHAREHRAEILAAALTVARAWYAAGKPAAPVPTIGGFTAWTTTLGGILAHAGVPGFLGNASQSYDTADQDATQWEAFLRALQATYRSETFTASQLAAALAAGPSTITEALPDDLADKLAHRKLTKATLGRALGAKADAYHGDDGIRITRATISGRTGVATWTVIHGAEDHPQRSRARRADPAPPCAQPRGRTREEGENPSASSAPLQLPETDR